ncbi:MAG: patatin-like phospholipase family protein, partial [Desulfobacteraceae bacterium]|nr:patatin-like phospholipase family protein [Desulfobacteraceae bacterium]
MVDDTDGIPKNEHSSPSPTAFLDKVHPLVTGLVCLLAAGALGLLFGLTFQYDRALKGGKSRAGIVDLELAFTRQRAQDIVVDWRALPLPNECRTDGTADGTVEEAASLAACARKSLRVDFWLILAYMVFGFSLLVLLLRATAIPFNRWWLLAALLPTLAGLFDLVENSFLSQFIAAPSRISAMAAAAASLAALNKFLLLGFFWTVVIAIAGFWAFARLTSLGRREPVTGVTKTLEEVKEAEKAYLLSRRRLARLGDDAECSWVGLALSGGGIRSATVNLGFLQVLMGAGKLRMFDYLCTVSGGGYIGAALSSLQAFKSKTTAAAGPDPDQYVFGPDDRPHFEATVAVGNAFASRLEKHPLPPHHAFLSGLMVVDHLRAYGEYLVRKRRLLSRDVLRAIGTVSSGMAATISLFGLILLLGAALVGAVIEAAGGDLPWVVPACNNAYWEVLWAAGGGLWPLAGAGAVGGVFLLGLGAAVNFASRGCPVGWFQRDGDTPVESRQHRALWICGFQAALVGFGILGPAVAYATPWTNALLFLPAFFLGGVLMTTLACAVLSVSASENPVLRSNPANRSFLSALNGLWFYFLLVAVVLVVLPWVLSVLQVAGSPKFKQNPITAVGGLGFLGAVASGLLAWLRNRKEAAQGRDQMQKIAGWIREAGGFVLKTALGAAVVVFLLAALVLALAAVVSLLAWCGAPDPGWGGQLAAAAVFGGILLALGYLMDANKLSLHYFYRDRLVEAYLQTEGPASGAKHGALEIKRDNGEMRLQELHGILRGKPDKQHDGQDSEKSAAPTEAFQQRTVTASSWLARLKLADPAMVDTEPFPGAATAAPYHLISTCLNLTTERDMRVRSRKSDIFIFSKLFCGSKATGFVDTGLYRSGGTKLARAMTISGAAADSAMG